MERNQTGAGCKTGPNGIQMKRVSVICFLFLCLSNCMAQETNQVAGNPSADEIPAAALDNRFSTNWYAEVEATLPPSSLTNGRYDFPAATNALCREAGKGNLAAQALWGTALIVLNISNESKVEGVALVKGAAEKGYVPAMMNLGYLYMGGKYIRWNYDEAFRWFSLAAEKGVAEAQLQLGGCYHYGLGVTPNYSMAARYYRLAAEQTNYVAMKSLGFLLMNGYGVDKNLDEAKYWLERAATEGKNRRAMFNLGALYSGKYPDTNAMAEAFRWFKQSAELGDALAANQLYIFYFNGLGGAGTNLASYRYWRFKAAYLGATEAQFFMGQAYRKGDGVPKDLENSLIWFGKAAAKNHPEALYDLALHYLEDRTNHASLLLANDLMVRAARMGHREAQFQCAASLFRGDVVLSYEMGKEWLAKSAENGWAKAEFLLFQFYYNGLAPAQNCPAYPQDKVEAVKWLRRAAEHGNYQAQSTLAVMLIRGMDMAQNKTEAGTWLRNAARHGYAPAQNDLGFAILDGDVTTANSLEAAMWCRLAAFNTTDPQTARRANINLASAMSRINFDEQLELDKQVSNFQPLPTLEIDPKISGWQTNPLYHQEDGQFGH